MMTYVEKKREEWEEFLRSETKRTFGPEASSGNPESVENPRTRVIPSWPEDRVTEVQKEALKAWGPR